LVIPFEYFNFDFIGPNKIFNLKKAVFLQSIILCFNRLAINFNILFNKNYPALKNSIINGPVKNINGNIMLKKVTSSSNYRKNQQDTLKSERITFDSNL
jgi:hypothetical protein